MVFDTAWDSVSCGELFSVAQSGKTAQACARFFRGKMGSVRFYGDISVFSQQRMAVDVV